MVNRFTSLALGSLLVLGMASGAMAQNVPGHPRVNEINQRLERQSDRIGAGVAQGQIGARGAARDARLDARVSQQLSRDEARHGGHITRGEQRQLNRELNRNSARIYDQRH